MIGTGMLVAILIVNGVIAHFVGKLADERRLGYAAGFLISFLLSPVLGLLFTIASQTLTADELAQRNTKVDIVEDKVVEEPNTVMGLLFAAFIISAGIAVAFYL